MATDRDHVWSYVNLAFNQVYLELSIPLDVGQFDAIEDAAPVIYSSERFGCQDYLPYKGGNP
jgi:hypothetical protein